MTDLNPAEIVDAAMSVRSPGDGTDPVRVLAEAYLEQVRLASLRLDRLMQVLDTQKRVDTLIGELCDRFEARSTEVWVAQLFRAALDSTDGAA